MLFRICLFNLLFLTSTFASNTIEANPTRSQKDIKTISWGHNLAPTANTVSKGVTTAGIYALAHGLTDDIMIATSPWFIYYYKMDNAVYKQKLHSDSDSQVAFQTAYFKSQEEAQLGTDARYYQMEASISNIIYTKKINNSYTISSNIGYHYYFDETVPFSIRRESFNDQPYQWNISSFHEYIVEDSYSFGFELGALGLNYLYPQLITGLSFNFKGSFWQMQLGMSFTGTPSGYLSSKSVDNNRALYNYTSQDKEKGRVDFSSHPEIQLQYFF